jgi:hypothetical protein
MSGLLAIQSVSGGGPNYSLTVMSSVGVIAGDHVVAPLLSNATRGGIYRVLSVPDGLTIDVTDDLVPGGGAYGAPTFGKSAYWTPIAGGLSTNKYNGTPFWGDITERDFLLVATGLDTSTKSGKLIPGDFSGTPKKATVTFITPFPDENYSSVVTVMTDGTVGFFVDTESKTVSGFVVNLHTNHIANLVEVDWLATTLGE